MSGARPAPYPADTLAKGWRFELNMEQVKKSDTWLRAKTGFVRAHLLLLWSESWEQTPCGSLPNDDELLALILDMEPEVFAVHKAVLMRGWQLADDGRLYHEVVTTRVLAMLQKRMNDAARTARNRAKQAGLDVDHAGVTRDTRVSHPQPTGEFDTKHQAPSTSIGTTSLSASPPDGPDFVNAKARRKPQRSDVTDPPGFLAFWQAWPASDRKQDRKKCADKWRIKGYGSIAAEIVAHVEACKGKGSWSRGYEPAPLTYLNGERWRDGLPQSAQPELVAMDV